MAIWMLPLLAVLAVAVHGVFVERRAVLASIVVWSARAVCRLP